MSLWKNWLIPMFVVPVCHTGTVCERERVPADESDAIYNAADAWMLLYPAAACISVKRMGQWVSSSEMLLHSHQKHQHLQKILRHRKS